MKNNFIICDQIINLAIFRMFAFQSCGYFNAKQDICNKDIGLEYLNYIKGKVEFCFVLRIFWKYHKKSQKWIRTNLILLFILICINAKRFISFSATQLQNCPCLRKQKNISSQLINSLNSLHNPSCLKWATVFFCFFLFDSYERKISL